MKKRRTRLLLVCLAAGVALLPGREAACPLPAAGESRVELEEDRVVVELSVLMSYGHTIPELCRAVQESVKNAVESMSGLEVAAVNVNVGGVTFPSKKA